MERAPRSILVVYTKPVQGCEYEFERWYTDVHLPEMLQLAPFVAARRFRFAPQDPAAPVPDLPFLAIYEVEAGRLEEARTLLAESLESSRVAVREGRKPILATSEALHSDRDVAWFEEIAAL